MSETGRVAVVLKNRGEFEFREYEVPSPSPDAIVVKMSQCNICGSDIHLWHGSAAPLQEGLPQILGHEMVGTVHKLGSQVETDSLGQKLEEGDRVVYTYFRLCGRCHFCLSGDANCPTLHAHWVGVSSDEPPHFNGGFGEYYYLGPGHSVFKIPDELPDDLVSPVNCAAAQMMFGLGKIGIRPGDAVVIQGAGGLGLYSIAMAREMGAGKILVIDARPERLKLAEDFGADLVLNVNETKERERLVSILKETNRLGADLGIEVAGFPPTLVEGIKMLRNGGRYLTTGNIIQGQVSIEPAEIVRKALTIQGAYGYQPRAIPEAIDFIARTKEKYPYEKLISHHYKFDDINEGMAFADEGNAIRVTLDF